MNLHIKMLSEGNAHHMIEAMFKAFAKALDMACSRDERINDVLSTKGALYYRKVFVYSKKFTLISLLFCSPLFK